MTAHAEPSPAALTTPPGGLLVWLLIALELATFGGGAVFFLIERAAAPEAFAAARATLDRPIAVTNTVLLVTSGFLVAQGVVAYKARRAKPAAWRLLAGALLGLGFVALKSVEYRAKLAAGHDIGSEPFFTFYWLLTGFHVLHVLVGVLLLGIVAAVVGRGRRIETPDAGVETAAAFWHLCDLIWIVLFPLLYLLR